MFLKDFTNDIANQTGLKKQDIRTVITELEKQIEEKLYSGIEITIFRIGKLQIVVQQPKQMRVINTAKLITTKKKYRIRFRVSTVFKEKLEKKPVY